MPECASEGLQRHDGFVKDLLKRRQQQQRYGRRKSQGIKLDFLNRRPSLACTSCYFFPIPSNYSYRAEIFPVSKALRIIFCLFAHILLTPTHSIRTPNQLLLIQRPPFPLYVFLSSLFLSISVAVHCSPLQGSCTSHRLQIRPLVPMVTVMSICLKNC